MLMIFPEIRRIEINQVERQITAMLLTEGLHVNESKTERYHIQKDGEDAWKKCKYLESLLHTEKDIKRHSNPFSAASMSVKMLR